MRNWAVLVAAVTPLSVAAQPPGQPGPRLADVMDVVVVNLEVWVTDRQGAPVEGLTRADFELRVDGRPVEISNFLDMAARRRAAGEVAGGVTAPAGGAAVAVEAESAEAVAVPPSHVVIYLDDESIRPFARRPLLEELAVFLRDQAARGNRLMLVTHGPRVQVRHRFQDDPRALPHLLTTLEEPGGSVRQLEAERDVIIRTMERTVIMPAGSAVVRSEVDLEDARTLLPRIRGYAQGLREQTRERLQAMEQFVGSLAGIQGAKVLVYVGEGIHAYPADGLFRMWEERYPTLARQEGMSTGLEANRYGLREEIKSLVSRANASLVSIFTLDAGDRGNLTMISSERGTTSSGPLPLVVGRVDQQISMQEISSKTGGETLGLGERFGSIQRLGERLEAYYSLGFDAAPFADGRERRVEVAVRRAGVKVRHRPAFTVQSLGERMKELTLAGLLYQRRNNRLGVELVKESERPREGGGHHVLLVMRMPMANITLLPVETVHEGRLSLYLALQSPGGRTSQVMEQPFPIRVPNQALLTALGQQVAFTFDLVLGAGQWRAALTVRDELAGTVAVETATLTVGRAATLEVPQ